MFTPFSDWLKRKSKPKTKLGHILQEPKKKKRASQEIPMGKKSAGCDQSVAGHVENSHRQSNLASVMMSWGLGRGPNKAVRFIGPNIKLRPLFTSLQPPPTPSTVAPGPLGKPVRCVLGLVPAILVDVGRAATI